MATDYVDHITPAALEEQNPGGNFSAEDDGNTPAYENGAAANAQFVYKGAESGCEFVLTNVISNGDWWCLASYSSGTDKPGRCYTTNSDLYIKQIKITFDYAPSYFGFYMSKNEVLNPDNYYYGTYQNIDNEDGSDAVLVWEATGQYKYVWMSSNGEKIKDYEITWTDEAPQVAAPTPTFNCGDDTYVPGTNVNVYTSNYSCYLHVDVYVNDVLQENLSKDYEASYCTIELPGKTGDKVRLEAYAYGEDFLQSATATWEAELSMPFAPRPELEEYSYNVVPGQELTLVCSLEGATVSYQCSITDWDNEDNNWESEKVEDVVPPVKIIVPETAPINSQYCITATSKAEGYQESKVTEIYKQVISPVLSAPNFSLSNGDEVKAGTEMTIYKPDNASEVHYIVNGGEEQVSDSYYIYVTINEDTEITAWATGEAPFIDSEKVTLTITVEVLSENTDALTPMFFTDVASDYMEYNQKTYEATSEKSDVSYVYDGGMYTYQGENCFYINTNGMVSAMLYNTTASENPYKRIKVDSPYGWSGMHFLFSKDTPFTEVTTEMLYYDYKNEATPGFFVNDNDPIANYGQWIDMQSEETAQKMGITVDDLKELRYFIMYRFSSPYYVSRLLVEYDSATGVEGITSENMEEGAIYNLNGIRMLGNDLTPGVYVRKGEGKVSKFIVK